MAYIHESSGQEQGEENTAKAAGDPRPADTAAEKEEEKAQTLRDTALESGGQMTAERTFRKDPGRQKGTDKHSGQAIQKRKDICSHRTPRMYRIPVEYSM